MSIPLKVIVTQVLQRELKGNMLPSAMLAYDFTTNIWREYSYIWKAQWSLIKVRLLVSQIVYRCQLKLVFEGSLSMGQVLVPGSGMFRGRHINHIRRTCAGF